jgi:hypothetical protein
MFSAIQSIRQGTIDPGGAIIMQGGNDTMIPKTKCSRSFVSGCGGFGKKTVCTTLSLFFALLLVVGPAGNAHAGAGDGFWQMDYSTVPPVGGTLTGDTAQQDSNGTSNTAVTALPNLGWQFDQWWTTPVYSIVIGAPFATAGATYWTGLVEADSEWTIEAQFSKIDYTLTVSPLGHGSVSPTSGTTYNYDSQLPVEATADTGYEFVNWTGDTTHLADANAASTALVNNLTGDTTITANFQELTRTVNFVAGANGTMGGTTPQSVQDTIGTADAGLTAPTPNTGPAVDDYTFTSWAITAGSGTPSDLSDVAMTITNITSDMTVTASFSPVTRTVTFLEGTGGVLVGGSPQTYDVKDNSEATPSVTANPDGNPGGFTNNSADFQLLDWSFVSGSIANITASGALTTAVDAVNEDVTVRANFVPISRTVTFLQSSGGVLVGGSPQAFSVNDWTQATPTVTADPDGDPAGTDNVADFQLLRWSYTGGNTNANITDELDYTTAVNEVDEDVTVTAFFAPVSRTVVFATSGPGSLDGSQPNPAYLDDFSGTATTPLAVPVTNGTTGADHAFINWTSADDLVIANDTHPQTGLNGVDENGTVTANFAQLTRTVLFTSTNTARGTVTPAAAQVIHDFTGIASGTATPRAGALTADFQLQTWDFTSGSDALIVSPANLNTNVTEVDEDVTVSAFFVPVSRTVTFVAGSNGSLDGSQPNPVDLEDWNGTISSPVALPLTNGTLGADFAFINWTSADSLLIDDATNPQTDVTQVDENGTVTANFEQLTRTVTFTSFSTARGTVAPVAPQEILDFTGTASGTATPRAGALTADYQLTQWAFTSGSDASIVTPTDETTDVTEVDEDVTVTAYFVPVTRTVTFVAGTNGYFIGGSVAVGNPTPENVDDWTGVTTSPIAYPVTNGNAGADFEFSNWTSTGDLTIVAPSATQTAVNQVDGDATVLANFVPVSRTVTFSAGANGTLTGGSPQVFSVADTSGATPAITAEPAAGFCLDTWALGGGPADVSPGLTDLTVSAANVQGDATLDASFRGIYSFTGYIDSSVPADIGVRNLGRWRATAGGTDFSGWRQHGETVSIPCDATSIQVEYNWQTCYDTPTTVTIAGIAGDVSATGTYTQLSGYTLTMGPKTGTAAALGTVEPAVGPHAYACGEEVIVKAIQSEYSEFMGWSGPVDDSAANTTTITMDADKTISAQFDDILYTLSVEKTGVGSVNPDVGFHQYAPDAYVTLIATPGPDYTFSQWVGAVDTVNSLSAHITMTQDLNVTAVFTQSTSPNEDNDGDGYTENGNTPGFSTGVDCNDNNDEIHPGATEICGDGIDQNCDGLDPNCIIDNDGDGYTTAQGDCDDNDSAVNPAAEEICGDGLDNDCDGIEIVSCNPSDIDQDGDGFSANAGDCNDDATDGTAATIYPGAHDVCSTPVDEDCYDGARPCDSADTCVEISQTPLDVQVQAAPTLLMFLLDDSGSMDWSFIVPVASEGKFEGSYNYVFDNPGNNSYTGVLPDAERGKWKSQYSDFNKMYFDQNAFYRPWPAVSNPTNQDPWPLMADANTTTPAANPYPINGGAYPLNTSGETQTFNFDAEAYYRLFKPDGRRITVTRTGGSAGGSTAADAIMLVPVVGAVQVFVTNSNDDTEQQYDGDMTPTSPDLGFNSDSTEYSGVRFRNVTFPADVTADPNNLTGVYLTFTSRNNDSGGSVAVRICGQEASGAVFATSDNDLTSGRTYTGTCVDWNITEDWTVGNEYRSPDLQDVLKEMIADGGVASGDNLVFRLENISASGRREPITYDDSPGEAPRLTIASAAAPLNDPIIIDNKDEGFVATNWSESSSPNEWEGSCYYSGTNGAVATWYVNLTLPGVYRVYAWWNSYTDRDQAADFHWYADGQATGAGTAFPTQDQSINGGQWNYMGDATFPGVATPFDLNVPRAHYYAWNDADSDEVIDNGEVYLVTLDGALAYYQFTDGNTIDVVEAGELTLDADPPRAVRPAYTDVFTVADAATAGATSMGIKKLDRELDTALAAGTEISVERRERHAR